MANDRLLKKHQFGDTKPDSWPGSYPVSGEGNQALTEKFRPSIVKFLTLEKSSFFIIDIF
jgi:hypothetical protein